MAYIRFVKKRNLESKRRFRLMMKARTYFYRLSVLLNLIALFYFLESQGKLTTILKYLAPIMERITKTASSF